MTKKMKQYLIAISLVMTLSSCKLLGTLYPLSENNKNFIFKKELKGKWNYKKDSSSFSIDTVPRTEGKLYLVNSIEFNDEKKENDTTRFLSHLINISGVYFFDCWYDMDNSMNGFFIARHFIIKLSFLSPDKIEMNFPDPEKLIKLIDQKKISLKYTELKEDDYLIIDKPAILQKGLAETIKYPDLYKSKEALILSRSK